MNNSPNKEIALEAIQFALRHQHNLRIKERFEEMGYDVAIVELQKPIDINQEFMIGDKTYIKIGFNFINTRKAYCIEVPDPQVEESNNDGDDEVYYYQEGDREVFPDATSIIRYLILPFRQLYWWAEIKYLYPLKRKVKLIKIKASRKKKMAL